MADFDPARYFAMGQQAKLGEQQLAIQRANAQARMAAAEIQQKKAARLGAIEEARASYARGDRNQLKLLDPEGYFDIRKKELGVEQAQLGVDTTRIDTSRKVALNKSRMAINALQKAQKNPALMKQIYSTLPSYGVEVPEAMIGDEVSPDAISSLIETEREKMNVMSDARATGELAAVMNRFGFNPDAMGLALNDPKVKGALGDLQNQKEEDRALRLKEHEVKLDDRQLKVAGDIRKEFLGSTIAKQGFLADLMAAKIKSASDSPAGHLSLVFAYMKMLDPNSVVRESEQDMARNAAGMDEKARNAWRLLAEGKPLTKDQIADFKRETGKLISGYRQKFDNLARQYGGLAKRHDIDVRDIIMRPQWDANAIMSDLDKTKPISVGESVEKELYGTKGAVVPKGFTVPDGFEVVE